MRHFIASLFIAACMTTTPALAHDHIHFDDAWVAPSIPGSKVGVGYFTISNQSEESISIVDAESPVAEVVELHTHQVVDDIMQMRKLDTIEIPAGHTVTARPHGLHLMLISLNTPLNEGDIVPLTLVMENGKKLTTEAKVEKRQSKMHGSHDADAHGSH